MVKVVQKDHFWLRTQMGEPGQMCSPCAIYILGVSIAGKVLAPLIETNRNGDAKRRSR